MNTSDAEDYHYRYKVMTLGDTRSGKSTLLDSNYNNNLSNLLKNITDLI